MYMYLSRYTRKGLLFIWGFKNMPNQTADYINTYVPYTKHKVYKDLPPLYYIPKIYIYYKVYATHEKNRVYKMRAYIEMGVLVEECGHKQQAYIEHIPYTFCM